MNYPKPISQDISSLIPDMDICSAVSMVCGFNLRQSFILVFVQQYLPCETVEFYADFPRLDQDTEQYGPNQGLPPREKRT